MANNKWNLFGFKIGKKDEKQEIVQPSFTPPSNEDGSYTVTSAAQFGTTALDLDGSSKNEVELITKYREASLQPELEAAIEDIVNEAIIHDEFGESVKLTMEKLRQSDKIKRAIEDEFKTILRLLNFNNLGGDIFRRWYIDGRLFYHVIVDVENPQKGIQELRYIDPRKIRKIREVKRQKDPNTGVDIITTAQEYYIYSERIQNTPAMASVAGVKIAPDSIINVNSGLMDPKRNMVLSYLHKALKPLSQLRIIEDAAVIYRLSRAPERRIFYIDVGNLPRIKAEQYVRDIMTKYKNKLVYDASTGEVKSDSKHLCLAMNTKIPLLDGRTLTLSEISQEYTEKQLWAYSCDPITGKFVPGLITWAGVTRKNAPVMKITLDNGKEIVCTPEHKFPTWKNGLVEAQHLTVGESMVPFYTREHHIKKNNPLDVYLQIFENSDKKWKFVHRAVSEWKDFFEMENEWTYEIVGEKKTVHHKDINKFNNNPENLVRMNTKDHLSYHLSLIPTEKRIEMGKKGGRTSSDTGKSQENWAKGRTKLAELMKDPEWNAEFRQKQSDGWSDESKDISRQRAIDINLCQQGADKIKELFKDPEHREKHTKKYKTEYTQQIIDLFNESILNGFTYKQICDNINTKADFASWAKLNENKVGSQKDWNKFVKSDIERLMKDFGFNGIKPYREYLQHKNHKIAKIEFLEETMDTGCLTIDGNELYHDYHTFALDAGVYTNNSMLEDYWLPRRSDQRSTEITTLPGAQNLAEIEDISYFEKKLYKSLGVPVTRLDPSQATSVGRATEITRDELKFSKFIDKLRAKFSELFDQALRIQLVLKGVCTEEEWNIFKESVFYDYIKDNNFIELKENELLQERLSVLAIIDQYAGKYYSKQWIRENILRLNDEDIIEMEKQIQEERDTDFKQQEQDQEKQIQLQAQAVQLQNELMPQPDQQIDAGDDGSGQQQKKNNNPYLQ